MNKKRKLPSLMGDIISERKHWLGIKGIEMIPLHISGVHTKILRVNIWQLYVVFNNSNYLLTAYK